MLLQLRLQIMSVILVIIALTIARNVVNAVALDDLNKLFNDTTSSPTIPPSSSPLTLITKYDNIKLSQNQSIDTNSPSIDSNYDKLDLSNSTNTTAQIYDQNNSSTTAYIESAGIYDKKVAKPTTLSAGKLYNKMEPRKRKMEKKSIVLSPDVLSDWKCPNISQSRNLECGCDMPHTLRCSGDIHSLEKIATGLRQSPYSVSLLDCTLKNVTFLSDAKIFENISLHGLVISSGEIKRVHRAAFLGLKSPLQALGLPNNALISVPWQSLTPLVSLDRFDLSNNRIKTLGPVDFLSLQNLSYLELSENLISSISLRTFTPLKKLITLKLNGNRLGDFATSLQAIGQSINLREVDLKSNSITGPLTQITLPPMPALESLNLDRNLLTSIQNGALHGFPYLVTLSLRHNQIDVLQDHAFSGLSSLQVLDLGYNGIVAVSGASLQHLSRLLVLDLTHNFLRALTSDLIAPLPALRELRLDGNDISIVSKNALDGASELHSLSLQDNPLSCDCTLKPFAEWLSLSKIPSQDLLGAICATPPHLEGAPLLQIPVESLNCDGNTNEYDNANVLQQLDAISKQSNLSYIKDFSDVISLKNLHLSADYGMILTWSVNLRSDEFTCDAVFVYKETNIHEILLDNSPIHCESYMMNDENIVSVILRNTADLVLGDSYRFCLVLLQEKNVKRDLVVGCSNITKLQAIENENLSDQNHADLQKLLFNTKNSAKFVMDDESSLLSTTYSDISNFDKISNQNDELTNPNNHESAVKGNFDEEIVNATPTKTFTKNPPIALLGSLNRSFLPGLGLGILITSFFVLIWGATKLKNDRHTNPAVSTCYAASADQITNINHEHENRNRYLKLQATTSL